MYLYSLSIFSELQVCKGSKYVKFLIKINFYFNAWDIEQ